MTKPLLVSKTFWVNLIGTLISILALVQDSPLVPPEALPWVALVVGVLNLVLRIWFTDAPIVGVV